MSDEKDRAEQIWLSAESLERQLIHGEADNAAVSLAADVVIAARELYAHLSGVS